MINDDTKEIYFNKMQREVMAIGAHTTVVVAGRGTGKGLLHAATMLRNFFAMPGSMTAYVAKDGNFAKVNTIFSMTEHWERWGYKEGLHWVIGIKPPKNLGWPDPYTKPEKWENVISFFNGSIAVIISQARKGTSNGMSFDFVQVDEAKFIDYEQFKDETVPANRGHVSKFGDCPWHHGYLITCDMPTTKKGSWFLSYEDKATPELVELIEGINVEIAELERQPIPDDAEAERRRISRINVLSRDMAKIQRHTVLFRTYSSLTNLEVLGESYVNEQKRNLPAATFQTAILCQRPFANKAGFYSSLAPRNLYEAGALDYGAGGRDADIDPTKALYIGMDYNSNINLLVVGQPDEEGGRLNVVRAMYVKYTRRLRELIDDFCHVYKDRERKHVVLYYDSTALGSNYAVNKEDFKFVICQQLRANGWKCLAVYVGRPMNHEEKHLLINEAFIGQQRLRIYINTTYCDDLVTAIKNALVRGGKKDKSGEKVPETQEDQLQHRTDFTDAFDTLVIGCLKFPRKFTSIAPVSDFRR